MEKEGEKKRGGSGDNMYIFISHHSVKINRSQQEKVDRRREDMFA